MKGDVDVDGAGGLWASPTTRIVGPSTAEKEEAGLGEGLDLGGEICRLCLSFFEKMPARIGIVEREKRESEGRASRRRAEEV